MIRAYVVIVDVWDCYRLSVKWAQTIQGVISKNTDDPWTMDILSSFIMRHLGKKKEAQAENNAKKYCSIEYRWNETFIVENPWILLSFSEYAYVK